MAHTEDEADPGRRRVLVTLGLGTGVALAGCIGAGGEPTYVDGEVGDVEGDERTPEEVVAAEAVAEQEIHESVSPLEELSIADHEFVFEDGYVGSTVQGTVENTGDDRIELVEVRVRVYDGGDQLGRYIGRTGDLDGGARWDFTVVLLESPADITDYDITVLGTPT